MAPNIFEQIEDSIYKFGDRFRIFGIGFSLYERAWTMRGLQTLLMDFYDNPQFVHLLLNSIADYNITQIKEAEI
jgi:uroporphyrinogen decarboxylase